MGNDPFKPKPLVDANLVTEFGGVEDLEQFKNEGISQHDYSYVPGASDQRVARDLAIGAFHRGEIRAKDVPTLEQNCRWFRRANKDGDPDNKRVVAARNTGYRPATKADIGSSWLTEMPPGAVENADGTIRSAGGDLQLFVAPKEAAARNAMRKKILAEQMVDGMEFAQGGLKQVGAQHKGATPTVTKQIGDITR